MKARLHRISVNAFVTIALSTSALLLAQTDQSKSSTSQSSARDQTQPVQVHQPAETQAPAQTSAPQAATAAQPDAPRAIIQLAGHEVKDRTAKEFIGHHVRGSDGRDLGALKDFLLDPRTGQIDFAVISSGGIAGMGDKLRLVPTKTLQRTGKKDEFALDMPDDQWKGLAALAEGDFKSGFYTSSVTSHLVRASDLAGRDVHSGHGKLGEIEAVVLDLDAGTAQALVDPNKDFTGIKEKLLVPFNQFTIPSGKRPEVTTLLTQADFQQARTGSQMATGVASSSNAQPQSPATQPSTERSPSAVANTQPAAGAQPQPDQATSDKSKPAATTSSNVAANESPAKSQSQATTPATTDRSGRVAATEKSPPTRDETLTPTGKTSADAIPAGTDPMLIATARAIRKALDNDAALASANVSVTPEDGKIVLRGRVNDQKTKTALIEKATSEIKGWKIDDQISIDNR